MINLIEGHFHHIGYACKTLELEMSFFECQGYKQDGLDFVDQIQGVRGRFITKDNAPRIELLENLEGSDRLTPWLNAGMGVYHFAYEVPDIFIALDQAKKNRALIVVHPTPAVAFNFKMIAFVMFRNSKLVEFIETKI